MCMGSLALARAVKPMQGVSKSIRAPVGYGWALDRPGRGARPREMGGTTMRNKRALIGAMLAAALIVGLLSTTASAGQRHRQEARWWGTGELTLVHGIDGDGGFPVD